MKEKEPIDEALRRMALEFNAPPPTPREEIWAGIEAKRGNDLEEYRRRKAGGRIRWLVGIAAVLLVGIGLGRWSVPVPGGQPSLAAARAESSALAYEIATTQHLSQAEALLTLARSATEDRLDVQTIAWAGDLLTTTRLLLDAQGTDPRLRVLLQDLELLLAEITHLGGRPLDSPTAKEELDLVKESIEQGSVLPRLRTAAPSALPNAAL